MIGEGLAERQAEEPLLVAGIVALNAVVHAGRPIVEQDNHPPTQVGAFGQNELPVQERKQSQRHNDAHDPAHLTTPRPSRRSSPEATA